MATVKKGTLTATPHRGRHLRDWKGLYWRRERGAARSDAAERVKETPSTLGIDGEIDGLMASRDHE